MNADEPALEEARRAGFDLSLLDCNLALTPEQRALQHALALEMAQTLRAAGEARYARPAFDPSKAR